MNFMYGGNWAVIGFWFFVWMVAFSGFSFDTADNLYDYDG